jgi:hypothetical protein
VGFEFVPRLLVSPGTALAGGASPAVGDGGVCVVVAAPVVIV